jgi:hypothetical protein
MLSNKEVRAIQRRAQRTLHTTRSKTWTGEELNQHYGSPVWYKVLAAVALLEMVSYSVVAGIVLIAF